MDSGVCGDLQKDDAAVVPTGGSLYAQNLRLRGRPPPTICARLDWPVNVLQLCRRHFSQLYCRSSSEMQFCSENGHSAF